MRSVEKLRGHIITKTYVRLFRMSYFVPLFLCSLEKSALSVQSVGKTSILLPAFPLIYVKKA